MEASKRMRVGKWLSLVLVAGLAWMLAGCESSDTDTDITPTKFVIDSDLVSYSDVDNYTWNTTLSQPLATIRIRDFTHGDATLRVYDARGEKVLDYYLFTPNNTIYVGSDEFVVSRLTDRGTPGAWRVELRYSEFTGDIEVTMQ